VDSYFIRKRDNPQVAAPQLWNCTPEPMTIVFLGLGTKRVVEDANAHSLLMYGRLRRTSLSKYSVKRYSAIWTDYRS